MWYFGSFMVFMALGGLINQIHASVNKEVAIAAKKIDEASSKLE
jgi:hypothetical protein